MAFDSDAPIDTTRLPERERRALQREIERTSRSGAGSERRESTRHAYHLDQLLARIFHPGSHDAKAYHVVPVDLSDHGLGFLHGTFLYPGSPCNVDLVTHDGERIQVDGRVVECRHIRGRIHLIGVRFLESIDVELFIEMDAANNQDEVSSAER